MHYCPLQSVVQRAVRDQQTRQHLDQITHDAAAAVATYVHLSCSSNPKLSSTSGRAHRQCKQGGDDVGHQHVVPLDGRVQHGDENGADNGQASVAHGGKPPGDGLAQEHARAQPALQGNTVQKSVLFAAKDDTSMAVRI